MRRSTLAFPWLLLSLVGGCSYYDASLLNPVGGKPDAGSTEGGVDATPDVELDVEVEAADVVSEGVVQEAGETGGCTYARPPDPPAEAEPGGDIEFTVAVYSVNFGDATGNPKEIGYDLDSRCTCHGEGNSCLRESWATAEACDGPNGEDNAAGSLLTNMGPYFKDFGSTAWSEALLEGEWSILLRVRGYNGQPNDSKVRLDWYVPDNYDEDKESGAVPSWDGNDVWPIRATCLVEQDGGTADIEKPRYFDDNAYVTNGVLVGSFTSSSFQVSADYVIEFNGTFITGTIVEGPMGWTLEGGLMASRWKLQSLLAQVGRISLLNLPVCTNHPAYPTLKAEFCSRADIFSGLGTPTTSCDSLSAGMRFETMPAVLGTIIYDSFSTSQCDPSVDPANDTCDS